MRWRGGGGGGCELVVEVVAETDGGDRNLIIIIEKIELIFNNHSDPFLPLNYSEAK